MAQLLRAVVTLSEELGSFHRTQRAANNHLQCLFQRIGCLFLPLVGIACTWYTVIHADKTLNSHKIKINMSKSY